MAAIIVTNGNRGLLSCNKVSIPDMGVPVPNNDEAVDWWYAQAEKDFNKTINTLALLEKKGYKWATRICMWLLEEV